MQATQTSKPRRRRRTREEMEEARKLARAQGLSETQIRLGAPLGSEADALRRSHNNRAGVHRHEVQRHGIVAPAGSAGTIENVDGSYYKEAGGGRVARNGKLPFLADLTAGILSAETIEFELRTQWPKHLDAALKVSGADTRVHDESIDKLPHRHIAGSYMTPLDELDGLTIGQFSYATFGRAMVTRVRFASSNYNLLEVALLTNVHHVVLLSLVNLHGMDWCHRLNVKLLGRMRGMFTVFKCDGNWHTPITFAFIYGGTPEAALKALESGKQPVAQRSMDEAINALSAAVRVPRDGFGTPALSTHMPLFTYEHMPEVVKVYPAGPKRTEAQRMQIPNVLDIEDDE